MIPIQFISDDEWITFTAGGMAVDAWVADDSGRCDALAGLRLYAEDYPEAVHFDSDRIVARHSAVAALRSSQARALGLPEPPPYVFTTDIQGVIGNANFKLTTCWLEANRSIPTRRQGAFLETASGRFLIPEPLLSAIELADRFKAGAADLPDHWAVLADFRRLIDPAAVGDSRSKMSDFLRNLQIYTGAALSLTLIKNANGEVDFDPVLFAADAVVKAEEQGQPPAERDGLLPNQQLRIFQQHPKTGFRAFDAAKRSYLLGNNTYLIVDDDLEIALQVVREKQQAPSAERRAFAVNPRMFIAARLPEPLPTAETETDAAALSATAEAIEERTASLFIETPDYTDRAIGIGIWKPPLLDFRKSAPDVWLPETFSLELGGVYLYVDRDTVVTLRNKVDAAMERGESLVEYQGEQIPATEEVRQKLAEAIGSESPIKRSSKDGKPKPPLALPTVIEVEENFVRENWRPDIPPRKALTATEPPVTIHTPLMPHQRQSLQWQIAAWQAGLPGALNADDQGLGKTLQTLAFLVWLQNNLAEGAKEKRLPILIVAPTGLLSIWEDEAKKHLTGIGLGVPIRLYGPDLRRRRGAQTGKDIDDGAARLDFDDLRNAIESGNGHQWWLLTTYETLAAYQHSLRPIGFAVVVFDEIQKIKNVKTLIALAARSVRADFRIGLTGTPIENHVADLWAIMDAVAPGRLSTLQEYTERYRNVTDERMRELHARVFKPTKNDDRMYPPVARRCFKEDQIEHLPAKNYRVYPTIMPETQACAYETARCHLADGARGGALKLLHHIRSVSLHPELPEIGQTDLEAYLSRSARLEALRHILTHIRERGERALLFIEDRRIQVFVAQWLRSKFGLSHVALINGATAVLKRRKIVRQFQSHLEDDRGFDVLILSPRAAGVGLTLTAATHVIHLSRWWNPAVEEQCNDRIYRIGQTRDVTVHLPLAIHPRYQERSFDCILNDLMRRKRALARAALWPPTDNDFDLGALIAGLNKTDPVDLAMIDDFDWRQFEDWVMRCARDSGDWEVSETPASGDGGADVILRHCSRRGVTALVQVKHTADRDRLMDKKAVHEIIAAPDQYRLSNPTLVVVTNARNFNDSAQQLAREHGVTLITGDRLGLWPHHVLG